MFVRKKKNKSGVISIQIIDKSSGNYRLVKTVGSSSDPENLAIMWQEAQKLLPLLTGQSTIDFLSDKDQAILNFMNDPISLRVRVIGPELILGRIFNDIGFSKIEDELFRHLVITRLVYPGSKLKTIDYLLRYQGRELQVDQVYRFLDRLNNRYKTEVEQIAYNYTKKILKGDPGIVFYDVTTLYFETSDEDDLRKTGFSKEGRHRNPQILLGFLVGNDGNPIGYEIFEGDKYEGHTLLPVLSNFEKRFNIKKPIVVADAGLLSDDNVRLLEASKYKYILGARIKNESNDIKRQILNLSLADGKCVEIWKDRKIRLIVSYSSSRAQNDKYNRERGLKRLERNLRTGKLTKSNINNRGYNKYLKLLGDIQIEINYEKFKSDIRWDGLKGYLTNAELPAVEIIENYRNLWHIEKAFRISKTDLQIRPIYHRLRDRIDAHICISFVAYTIYKELERILKESKVGFSAKRALELMQTMYALDFKLPDSKQNKTICVALDKDQMLLKKTFEA